jgi:hypothetical protein
VRPDFRSDAILERRDDLSARRVILRVRGEDEHDVELQPNRIALNLDVALLKDVEQADLDLPGEIGELVHGEDPAVRPRQQPVVHRQLVGQIQSGLRRLDRVDVADHVGDRHVRRRELLDETVFTPQPADGQAIAFSGNPRAAAGAQRRRRVVVNFAARHDRDSLVEQIDEAAQDARLRLAAQAEQDEIVAREDRVDELRHDGVVVADDAREKRLARPELAHEVVADFLFDRP